VLLYVYIHVDTHRHHTHTQMRTGHYELTPTWVHERGGLDLVRFNSLWKSNVSPEDLQVQDIVNIMFPHAHFGGDDTDSSDEDTNFTQAASSSGIRDDTHSNEKRHRVRYFNKTDHKVKRVTDAARFQDALNEVKGQRARKILSEALISFDNVDEYAEFKDYTDPVFTDDIMKVFKTQDNTEERMTVLDEIMLDIQADRACFARQDDFISLASSRITIENSMDEDSDADEDNDG
jgi:hypothetical protein